MKTKNITLNQKKLKALILAKLLHSCAKASFTIEAAVIVPLSLIIVVLLINTSFNVHNKVKSDCLSISNVIQQAPNIIDENSNLQSLETELDDCSLSIDLDMLDGRQVLLDYMLIKHGYMILTGGLDDEN